MIAMTCFVTGIGIGILVGIFMFQKQGFPPTISLVCFGIAGLIGIIAILHNKRGG